MMNRAFMISSAAHLVLLLLLWQIGVVFSRPATRAYPRLMTATLVAKSVMAPAPLVAGPPAAVLAAPEPQKNLPETPAFKPAAPKPIEKKKEPEKNTSKPNPQKSSASTKTTSSKASLVSSQSSAKTTGAAAANKAGGGGGNSIKIDAAAFPYAYYSDAIQNRIESNWQAPAGPERLAAVVFFRIARNGEIRDIKLEQASGSFDFDRAAISAVTYANPLPPLPVDYREQTLVIRYEFVANNF